MFAVGDACLFYLRYPWEPMPLQEAYLLSASNNWGGGLLNYSPTWGDRHGGARMVAIHKAHSGFPSGGRSRQEGRCGAKRKTLQPLKNRLSNTWVSL